METGKARTAEQRLKDKQFLIKLMNDNPDVSKMDCYLLLLNHIKERGDDYEVSITVVYRDIKEINNLSVQSVGINLTGEKQKAIDDYDMMLTALIEELNIRINQDRTTEETTIEDLQAKDINKLAVDELMIFHKIRNEIKKVTVRRRKIRRGSDIKEICESIALMWKEKRKMLGIDAPTKREVTNLYTPIDEMSNDELTELLKELGGNKEKILDFLTDIFDNKN